MGMASVAKRILIASQEIMSDCICKKIHIIQNPLSQIQNIYCNTLHGYHFLEIGANANNSDSMLTKWVHMIRCSACELMHFAKMHPFHHHPRPHPHPHPHPHPPIPPPLSRLIRNMQLSHEIYCVIYANCINTMTEVLSNYHIVLSETTVGRRSVYDVCQSFPFYFIIRWLWVSSSQCVLLAYQCKGISVS